MIADTDPSFSLGEVLKCVLRLPNVPITPRGGRHFLMELLRRGEFTAHILLPGDSGTEVQIPAGYWADVDMPRFQSLGRTKGPGAGSFHLELWDISEQTIGAIERALRKSKEPEATLRGLVSAKLSETREVYVRQSALEKWLQENGHSLEELMHTDEPEESRRGRKRGDREHFFRGLCRYLLRELGKKDERYQEPKQEALAEIGRSEAIAMGASTKLPSVATLKKEIAKLLD